MSPDQEETLLQAAWAAREKSYSPYSRFPVGAALLTTHGEIFPGCNVENVSFGLTICAERTALVSAVARGFQSFAGLAVVADSKDPISPCGACRQVIAEFGDIPIICANLTGAVFRTRLADLLPRAKTGILDPPPPVEL